MTGEGGKQRKGPTNRGETLFDTAVVAKPMSRRLQGVVARR